MRLLEYSTLWGADAHLASSACEGPCPLVRLTLSLAGWKHSELEALPLPLYPHALVLVTFHVLSPLVMMALRTWTGTGSFLLVAQL